MIKRLYIKHKFIFNLISSIIITSFFINIFIPKNLVVLSGEFLFSFSYIDHFKNLVSNYLLNPNQFSSLVQCGNCPIFYHISSWYMAWVFGVLSIGQLLGLHPVVYYFLITVIVQVAALYLLIRVLWKDFNKAAFVTASIFFIFSPYKFYLVPSATLDGVIYGLVVGAIALWLHLLVNISKIKFKKLFKISIILGLICSLFLNFAIAYLPLFFYGIFILTIPWLRAVIKNYKKVFLGSLIIALVVVLINMPIIVSQVIAGNTHYLTSFIPVPLHSSLSAGFVTAGVDAKLLILFFITIIYLIYIAPLKRKTKILLVFAYFLSAFLMSGGRIGDKYLYQYIFDHIPLMSHIRGLYRLNVFEYIILFIFIYLGIKRLNESRVIASKMLSYCILIFILFIASSYFKSSNLFHAGFISDDYRQTQEYLRNKNDKKVYFPTFGPYGKEFMSGNYSWFPSWPVFNATLYSSPFTSILFLQNQNFTEGYQLSDVYEAQLRSLISYQDSPEESIKFLESIGIKYLIVDKNYLWKKIYPNFKLDEISKYARLNKKIGKIDIYKLEDKSRDCKKSYGDFIVGYCRTNENPEYLINRTVREYSLDMIEISKSKEVLEINKSVKLPDMIVNSPLLEKVIEEKLFFPSYKIYQADNNLKDIFKKNLSKGQYVLYVPILRLDKNGKLFYGSKMVVRINGKVVKSIEPYGSMQGFRWEETTIDLKKDSLVTVSAEGQGWVVFGNPILLSESSKELEELENHYKDLKIVDTNE